MAQSLMKHLPASPGTWMCVFTPVLDRRILRDTMGGLPWTTNLLMLAFHGSRPAVLRDRRGHMAMGLRYKILFLTIIAYFCLCLVSPSSHRAKTTDPDHACATEPETRSPFAQEGDTLFPTDIYHEVFFKRQPAEHSGLQLQLCPCSAGREEETEPHTCAGLSTPTSSVPEKIKSLYLIPPLLEFFHLHSLPVNKNSV